MPTPSDLSWAVDGPPIGVWTTALGTFDALMKDVLSLRPDGTGYLATRSPMRGEEVFWVMWKQPGPGLLQLAMLLPDDDPQAPPEYETIRYGAAEAQADVGHATPVLRNDDDDAFWTLGGPVKLVSRRPD